MKKSYYIVFLLFFLLIGCSNGEITIKLEGNSVVNVEIGETFTDPGAKVSNGNEVIKSGTVNTAVLGDYTITYKAIDSEGNTSKEITRLVKVIDSTAPELTLRNNVSVSKGIFNVETLIDEVTDNYDDVDDLTIDSNYDEVVDPDIPGQYTVEVTVTDTSGNETKTSTNIQLVVSDESALLDYFMQNGEEKTDDDGETYYNIVYTQVSPDQNLSLSVFEDGYLKIYDQFNHEDGTASSVILEFYYGDFSFFYLTYAELDTYWDVTDGGFDDDALFTDDGDFIVVFDDSTFSSYTEDTYETIAEGYALLAYYEVQDYFSSNIGVDLK